MQNFLEIVLKETKQTGLESKRRCKNARVWYTQQGIIERN